MRNRAILEGFGWARAAGLALVVAGLAACGSDEGTRKVGGGSSPGAGASGNGDGSGATGNQGTGSTLLPPDGTGGTDDGGREVVCNDDGVCTCIGIAVFGRQGTYGAVPGSDGTSAIEAWLNENSNAAVQSYQQKPAITPEFFEGLDVILLEAMETQEGAGNQWQFTPDELATFEAWVRGGGGVIALTGYGGFPSEVEPTHALIGFSGLAYAGLTGPGDTATAADDTCAYCRGNSYSQGGWNSAHPIAREITAVGALYGRSVSVPPDGEIVAQAGAQVFGATVQVDAGRVFMFHDEWVTYTSQWDGSSLENDCRTIDDPNHSCLGVHPTTTYQVPQFWYNALRWVSGDPECFDIEDPVIVR